ncbi:apoptosis-enhancing nuclease-like [Spea bombifrons]|uniref:apoptosis-enhancing nuclease-like n=1 Tax=Spea bombifrons TaxID=233779 RepID=UPI00234954D6|nr:apoptosis-enhancing nuclease-like [Spea bombifrons]
MKDSTSLFHGFSESRQYLSSPHTDVPGDHLQILCVRNRRRSRKHQRCVRRKDFLERGLIGTEEMESQELSQIKIQTSDNGTTPLSSHQTCGKTPGKDLRSKFAKLSELKTMLGGSLPGLSAFSPVGLVSKDVGYDSGLSVPSSTTSSRPSSPVAWLKPGKCVAIDCEMVGTGPGARVSELARCSVVNYSGEVIYDKYIKPELPITDYRTRWSGITKIHMKNAISFKTAQKEILNLLKDNRVVGHALQNDFKALKYFHPSAQTRDTSKIRLLKKMAGLPSNHNVSLKSLAWCLLHKRIQIGKKGHSSAEDAQTCMELYKLVEDQWEQDLRFHSEQSTSTSPAGSSVSSFMDDQYWPPDLNENYR